MINISEVYINLILFRNMTHTRNLSKAAFRDLKHFIQSDNFTTENVVKHAKELKKLRAEYKPQVKDFESLQEFDFISLFGLQLCRQKIEEMKNSTSSPTPEFKNLMKEIYLIEESLLNIMDFERLSNLLDQRIHDLS